MTEIGYIAEDGRGWVYDFEKLRLPHDVLVAYHKHAVEKYGPRRLDTTLEQEENDLSVLWLIENAMHELRRYGWKKKDIKEYVLKVVKTL